MAWVNRIVGEGEEAPDQLLSNPRNWRIHPAEQEKALSGVLNEVGVVQRVVVNQHTGFVVDGHLRVAMAIREGVPSIPVTYVWLSDEEEAVVLATFDSITGMAGTDRGKLDELLAEVRDGEVAQGNEDLAGLLALLGASGGGGGRGEGDEDAPPQHRCPECGYEW